jgi:type IV secretion system protein VirD4
MEAAPVFRFSRLLLVIAFMEGLYAIAIFSLVCSPLPVLMPLAFIVIERALRAKPRWSHGTAQWASEQELRRNGMIGGNQGRAIGRMAGGEVAPIIPSLLSVMNSRTPAQEACEKFYGRLAQAVLPVRSRGEVVRLSRSVHTAVFGPTGAGKGASFIVPWLLETNESAVILDYKAENAKFSAKHRETVFGHQIVLLDPFCAFTQNPDCFNPVDEIVADSPNAIDDCRDLAEQLVVRTGDEKEPHWNDSAEAWIGATIAAVALHGQKDNRSLQTARDVLSNPDKIPQLIELLCQSGGMVARLGGQLAHFRDKELSSTLTTANRHLRFLDTPAVAANTCRSTFDPNRLRAGRMTIYCILPPEHMNSQTALLRMWIGSLTRAVVRGGLQHG